MKGQNLVSEGFKEKQEIITMVGPASLQFGIHKSWRSEKVSLGSENTFSPQCENTFPVARTHSYHPASFSDCFLSSFM